MRLVKPYQVSSQTGPPKAAFGTMPNEANSLVVLIIGILELRTNERGIGQENGPNFRPAARNVERENSPGQGFVAEALRDIVVNYGCRDRADPLWQFGAG